MDSSASPSATGFDAAKLIEAHQTGVWRYLRALGCSPDEASDLTQETFLAVLQKPFRVYSHTSAAAYLRTVARHLLISQRRRSGRWTLVEDLEILDTEWSRWVGEDNGETLLEALRSCLAKLTDRARLALELRFRDHESRENIAARLNVTEHGAKNLMQRAKQQLRECVAGKLN